MVLFLSIGIITTTATTTTIQIKEFKEKYKISASSLVKSSISYEIRSDRSTCIVQSLFGEVSDKRAYLFVCVAAKYR